MENRKATWLELFFDLIFVVALGKVTHILAETDQSFISLETAVTFVVLFLPFWWVWTLHTSFSNRIKCDRTLHKVLTLLLMFLLIILSTTLNEGIENDHVTFLIIYGIVKLCAAVIYITDIMAVNDREISKRIVAAIIGGTLLALSGIFLHYEIAAIVLVISIILEIVIIQTALNASKATQPVNKEHLVERIGLLAIVLLGESVISLSYGLTKVEWAPMNITAGILGFSIIAMIWWIYFGSLRFLIESGRDKYGTGIIYSQLFVFMSFSVLANTIRHAILNDLDLYDFRIMAISGMILLYVGKQTAYAINRPQYMKSRIIRTAVVLAIAGVSLLLPKAEFILAGIVLSFLVYILMTYRDQESHENDIMEDHTS
ncbi:Low temperature requirement protein LtrA [Nonlabens sp. Hel1_33_55]|uniref:low temperature requirement protein A n=1 Tax=Nonlabens sp. Hel1_33_55 TaxID=1336802 RepID=UPI000875BB41|nr:low temperature requirement protein A [Nonlabens sp. Hel1_33_55]SCY08068.1 Low temperature requirement protein LtrA [Nonlabens sp. Hel1_33_55]